MFAQTKLFYNAKNSLRRTISPNGEVIKTTGFGAFAEFSDGLEGLIHVSQLSSEKVSHPEKVVKVGDVVKAKVVKVDTENKKIGLSIKAYEENMDVSAIEKEQALIENEKTGLQEEE